MNGYCWSSGTSPSETPGGHGSKRVGSLFQIVDCTRNCHLWGDWRRQDELLHVSLRGANPRLSSRRCQSVGRRARTRSQRLTSVKRCERCSESMAGKKLIWRSASTARIAIIRCTTISKLMRSPTAIASLLNNLFGRGKEPFWQQAYCQPGQVHHPAPQGQLRLRDAFRCVRMRHQSRETGDED